MGRAPMPLVGREREMAQIGEALSRAEAGHGGVLVVEGEAGIGKSRLLAEGAEIATTRGFDVLAAACTEPERTLPFSAALRLFRPFTGAQPASAPVPEIDVDEAMAPASQFRLTEQLGNTVEARAAHGPVLVVIDDLQWADPSTLLVLRSVAGRIEHLPVLVLGALRAGHQSAEVHRLADDLFRSGAMHLTLPPLDDGAVASLAAAVVGGQPSPQLLAGALRAGGNPLYVTEYARMAADSGGRLPAEFRLTVQRRLGHLSLGVRDIVRLASVLGSTFEPRHLAVALKRSAIELAPTLDEALKEGVIEERDDVLAFRHDLVRQAVYDDIAPALQRALHKDVGHRLAEAGAHPLVVAHHLRLGADAIDAEAADWLHRAARDAFHRAPAVAAELLEQARDLLPVSSADRLEVLADLVAAYAWSGRLAEAAALAGEVLSRPLGAALAVSLRAALVRALSWQGHPAEALDRAGLGDDESSEAPGADLLAAETAMARYIAFDLMGAGVMADRAEAAATQSGNALALCQALSVKVGVATFTGRPHEAVELGRRAVAIADKSPDGSAQLAHPRFFPGMPLVMLDRLDEADRLLREGRQYAEERGLVWSLPMYYAFLCSKLFAAGEWDAAVAEGEAGLAVVEGLGVALPQVHVTAAWLAAIQVHRDELEAAERTIATAQRLGPSIPNVLLNWATALLHEARGEMAPALARLQGSWDLLAQGKALADPFAPMTLVRLCVANGDPGRAEALLPAVTRQAEITGTAFMRAQALRCRGLVRDDPQFLLDAVTEYRQCPRPAELAAGCEDAGAALARHHRVEEAVPLLEESHRIYEDLNARRDAARVRAMLRDCGVRQVGRRRRASADNGWDSLTDMELKVVDLVAQRLSNPEVAERLFISRHTVESHLKHVYRKLGLTSRIELAAAAAGRVTTASTPR